MELNKIIQHNVLSPWPLPDKSIHCIVTSPPYWALRDYGIEGQLGLEKTPEEYIERMVLVFEEARRVLRNDGTLWLNIGDSYAGGKVGRDDQQRFYDRTHGYQCKSIESSKSRAKVYGIKSKDLIGIPWMLAFALRSAGWYLRQDIIWHKPNPMPESAQDRCTKAHEYIFLLSKSKTYYYDPFSIGTPYKDKTLTTFGIESKGNGDGSGMIQSENWARDVKVRKPKEWKMPDGWDTSSGSHGSFHRNGREKGRRPRPGIDEKGGNQSKGDIPFDGGRANKRSVWTVATQAFKEAHFATFPPELILDCIKAGCPPGGIVLDPFMGAGTTGLVAMRQGRNFIGFELNPKYIEIANRRIKGEFPLFYQP